IEQVRDAADLLEIVQESVTLKRSGSDWRGPCPFHGGTNRNFAVIPRKNLYYCFVCHASGDVFTWYRERFGMDYLTAVREVARRVGMTIPEQPERTGPDPREPLFQACDAARSWYAARLRDGADAETTRRYLLERQFPLDAAAEHGLGWAPRGGDFLAAMRELGVSDETLEAAALVQRRDDGTLYPRFRDRLLFPIHDLRGRVVGFGGRLLGAGEPKYLNSPETPIFHKGEQLYHLHIAKLAIRKAGLAILVEGYFDALRLSLAGIDQVVAPLGTALTTAQARLLRRYTSEVVICYDSDAPGLRATFRAADVLLAEGVRVRVATLPEGDDPDTVVQRGGAAALEALLGDAIDVLDRKLQLLELRGWFGDMHRTREALDRLLPTLQAPSDQITRELYVTRVADKLGIPRETVAAEAVAPVPRPAVQVAPPGPVSSSPGSHRGRRPPRGARTPGSEIERKLLRILVRHPAWRERARGEIAPDRFTVRTFRTIYEAMMDLPADAPAGDVGGRLDQRAREAWQMLLQDEPEADGFRVDDEYAGALAALEEIHSFADVAAEADPRERQRRWQAMSREGQTRFRLYLDTMRRAAAGSAEPIPEE
ncbi:MAG TPA: DNA primase, partial [Gemmatimonadales bacterium]|nr:DNA primase [Gemmatimonadales bacterium]